MFLLWQTSHGAVEAAGEATESGGSEGGAPHLFNIVAYLSERLHMPVLEDWINVIYSFAIMLLVFLFFSHIARHLKKEPGRLQNFVEILFTWLEGFVDEMLGPKGRKYIALVGSLFIYILTMNLFGLVPVVGHSPSSNLNITLSLALVVFITVQIHGMRELGVVGYLAHFADLPAHQRPTVIQLCLSPLMLVLHIIGELAKPMSLSLRLFGNITGEDTLIAIFVLLLAQWFVPLHTFMYPIAILGGFIQALVFSLLTAVYLMQMSAHEEH
jgi:F-type H+-transporting ATPase subunit a